MQIVLVNLQGLASISVSSATPVSTGVAIDSISATAPSCQGGADGSADLFFNGVPPFTFAMGVLAKQLRILSNLTTGMYTVTVTDGCGTTATQSVNVPDGPPPTAIVLASNSPQQYCPSFWMW